VAARAEETAARMGRRREANIVESKACFGNE
jgi:hypothetical protein